MVYRAQVKQGKELIAPSGEILKPISVPGTIVVASSELKVVKGGG